MAPKRQRHHDTEEQQSNTGTAELPPETAPTHREPGDENGQETEERKPFPPMRPWQHSNDAGVELLSYSDKIKKIYQTMLKFRDCKPSQEVRAHLKEHGYRWAADAPQGGVFNVEGAWVRDNKGPDIALDRLVGERSYQKVRNMILKEKGIEAPAQEGPTPF